MPVLLLAIACAVVATGCATASGLEGLGNEYYILAKDAEARKDADKALNYYRKAVSLQPGNRMARLSLSRLLLAKAEYDQAEKLLDSLALEDPGNLIVLESQAYLAAQRQRWEDAWDLYSRVNAKTEARISVLYNLALIGGKAGKVEEAAAHAEDLADLRPGEPRYQRLALECLLAAGQDERVGHFLDAYLEAARSKPDDMVAFSGTLMEAGQEDLSRRVIDAVLSIDSKNPKALFALASLQLGKDAGASVGSLTKAMDAGYADREGLRDMVARADQASRALMIEVIRKKISDFTVADRAVGKKIPGRYGHLPGEF
jgi:predicted Zn-dependent protease